MKKGCYQCYTIKEDFKYQICVLFNGCKYLPISILDLVPDKIIMMAFC